MTELTPSVQENKSKQKSCQLFTVFLLYIYITYVCPFVTCAENVRTVLSCSNINKSLRCNVRHVSFPQTNDTYTRGDIIGRV